MAHSLSAKKRVRQSAKKRTVNRARRGQIRTQIKHLDAVLTEGNVEAVGAQFHATARGLDKMVAKGTMHKKTAARKKSRLAKRVNALTSKKSG